MMKIAISFSILLVFAFAEDLSNKFITRTHDFIVPVNSDNFFIKSERNERISGGTPAGNNQFPYIGELTIRWSDGTVTPCTGSLITNLYVLTARRCVFNDLTNQAGMSLRTEFGSARRENSRTVAYGVWAVWKDGINNEHPDFALLRLANPLTLSDSINVIQLPPLSLRDEWNQQTINVVPGWGGVDNNAGPFLTFAIFGTTARAECTEDYVAGITPYRFCNIPSGTASVTAGDYGAPVTIFALDGSTRMVIGVTSINLFSSTRLRLVSTATQIGQFLTFIHETTGVELRP